MQILEAYIMFYRKIILSHAWKLNLTPWDFTHPMFYQWAAMNSLMKLHYFVYVWHPFCASYGSTIFNKQAVWGSRLRNWGEKVWALLKKEICFVYFYVWLVRTLDAMVYLCQCTLHDKSSLNPLTLKIMLVILLTSAIQFLWCLFGEFGIGSSCIPIIYIFLYSHHFSAWYCVDIVRRNSILVTHGS